MYLGNFEVLIIFRESNFINSHILTLYVWMKILPRHVKTIVFIFMSRMSYTQQMNNHVGGGLVINGMGVWMTLKFSKLKELILYRNVWLVKGHLPSFCMLRASTYVLLYRVSGVLFSQIRTRASFTSWERWWIYLNQCNPISECESDRHILLLYPKFPLKEYSWYNGGD